MNVIVTLKDMPRAQSGMRPSDAIKGWIEDQKRKFAEEESEEASPKKCKKSSNEENEYCNDKQESLE